MTDVNVIDSIIEETKKDIPGIRGGNRNVPSSNEENTLEKNKAASMAKILEMMGLPQDRTIKDYKPSPKKDLIPSPIIPEKGSVFDSIFDQNTVGKIRSLFISKQANQKGIIEIEASLGLFYNKSFKPGVNSIFSFNYINQKLQFFKENTIGIDSTSVVSIAETNYNSDVRKITTFVPGQDSKIIYEKKTKLSTIDIQKWGIRVSKSRETDLGSNFSEENIEERNFDNKRTSNNQLPVTDDLRNKYKFVQRRRDRTTFRVTGENIKIDGRKIGGIQFDISSIRECAKKFNGKTTEINKFEVEVEVVHTKDKKKLNIDNFLNAIFLLLKWSVEAKYDDQITPLSERRLVAHKINKLFSYKENDVYKIFDRFQNKAKNIKIRHLLEPENWAVTVKTDGVRKFLFLGKTGIYLISPPYSIIKIGPSFTGDIKSTFLDGEYVISNESGVDVYHIFDTLFYNGIDVRPSHFEERQKNFVSIGNDFQSNSNVLFKTYKIKSKTFYQGGEKLYPNTKYAMKEIDGRTDLYDGIIMQPIDAPYRSANDSNFSTYKWKFPKLMTIDFKLKCLSKEEVDEENKNLEPEEMVEIGKIYWTCVQTENNNLETFTGIDGEFWGYLYDEEYEPGALDGKIVECNWVRYGGEDEGEGEGFQPLRIRNDITQPNFIAVAKSVWQDIKNPIKESTILGNDLVVMRKYNNKEKVLMLNNQFGQKDTIVDFGSGRGADLGKWADAKIKKIFAVEPDEENRNEFVNRLKSLKKKLDDRDKSYLPDIKLIPTVAQDIETISEIVGQDKITGITSFFSLTFFFESSEVFEGLVNTLDSLLEIGGKFIGIVMDGGRTDELLNKNKGSVDNVAFSIQRKSSDNENPFGNEIEINLKEESAIVKSQTEWLFNFDYFVNSLKAIGLDLDQDWFLDTGATYEGLPVISETFSRLSRAFVFVRTAKPERQVIKDEELFDEEFDELFEGEDKDEINDLLQEVEDQIQEEIVTTIPTPEEQEILKDINIKLKINAPEDTDIPINFPLTVPGTITGSKDEIQDAIFSSAKSGKYNKLKTSEEREAFINEKVEALQDQIDEPMIYARLMVKNLFVVDIDDDPNIFKDGALIEGTLEDVYFPINDKKQRYVESIVILHKGNRYYNLSARKSRKLHFKNYFKKN
ncbi:hypothetical protein OAG24_00980 [bacterium]|nr:hypothetical protein [bacterium]